MGITIKQINYIIYILESTEDRRLQKLYKRIPDHNEKYTDPFPDYRRTIAAEGLARMDRREAGELIGAIKSPSDQNIAKVERALKIINLIA